MSTIKPPMPSDFTGQVRSFEAVDIFFHQLGVFLRLSKVAEEDKTDVASMFLKDRAYRWFMTKQASIAKFTYFERECCAFFIPPDEQSVLIKRFNDATQDRSSVADFALELRTIADTLGDIPERMLKHQFTNGLRTSIQAILAGYTTKADTWDELVEKALKAEDIAAKVSAAKHSHYLQWN
jgi:Retrotransposon gag protein